MAKKISFEEWRAELDRLASETVEDRILDHLQGVMERSYKLGELRLDMLPSGRDIAKAVGGGESTIYRHLDGMRRAGTVKAARCGARWRFFI